MARKRSTRKSKAGTRKNSQSRMIDDVLSLAGTLLSAKKDWVTDKVSNLSSATHAYAEALNDVPGVGAYATSTADTFDDFAEYLVTLILMTWCVMARCLPKDIRFKPLLVQSWREFIATQIYRSGPKAR